MDSFMKVALSVLSVAFLFPSAWAQCTAGNKASVDVCITKFVIENPEVKVDANTCNTENLKGNCAPYGDLKECLVTADAISGVCRAHADTIFSENNVVCTYEEIAEYACGAAFVNFSAIAISVAVVVASLL